MNSLKTQKPPQKSASTSSVSRSSHSRLSSAPTVHPFMLPPATPYHSPLAFGPYLGVGNTQQPDSSENDDDDNDNDNEEEGEEEGVIYTRSSKSGPTDTPTLATPTPSFINITNTSSTNTATTSTNNSSSASSSSTGGLRHRFFTGLNDRFYNNFNFKPRSSSPKTISTTPGQLGAGETETEADEPPRRLPIARITVPSSEPLIPPNTLQQSLTPLLFEFSRLLAIVPAVIGTLYNLYHACYPHPFQRPERIDFIVSALWAILTGYQCLALTTGLLTRWRVYYEPLSTLVRLLALQGICWPATQITLSIFEHQKRPLIVWALIGTTTCCSRSVQIWATSNLWWETTRVPASSAASTTTAAANGGGGLDVNGSSVDHEVVSGVSSQRGYWRRWGGKWGGRRWDWKEVSIKCVLPAGIMYFLTAWAELLRREWER